MSATAGPQQTGGEQEAPTRITSQEPTRDPSPTQADALPREQAGSRWQWLTWLGGANTSLLTVIALVGGWFIYQQLAEMRETNRLTQIALSRPENEAEESDRVIARALELTERSARAAERAAEAAMAGLDATRRQLSISESSLAVTDRSIRNRERPWVVFSNSASRASPSGNVGMQVRRGLGRA